MPKVKLIMLKKSLNRNKIEGKVWGGFADAHPQSPAGGFADAHPQTPAGRFADAHPQSPAGS